MKRHFALYAGLLSLTLSVAVGPSAWAQGANRVEQGQQFFQTLNDVPLMPGLYEMLDESVVFDKPGGRIVESAAATEALAGSEIHSFYEKTLPQLGWAKVADDTFVRQGELLTLNVEGQGDYKVVRFMVAPR